MTEKPEEEMEASSTAAASSIPLPFSSQTPSVFPFVGGFFDADGDGGDQDSLGFLELLGLRDLHQAVPPFLFDQLPPAPDPPQAAGRGAEPSDGGNIPATPSSISTSSSTEAAAAATAIRALTPSPAAASGDVGSEQPGQTSKA